MSYRDELIQVAAVAVAMVEDIDYGMAHTIHDPMGFARIITEIKDERVQQDAKWGPQHHDPALWLTILMEEVGEAAKAHLEVGETPS